jgi:hypothetical protein
LAAAGVTLFKQEDDGLAVLRAQLRHHAEEPSGRENEGDDVLLSDAIKKAVVRGPQSEGVW